DMLRSLPPDRHHSPGRPLAAAFAVSRTTVRKALAELTVEGRLLRVQGKGTFAAKPKVAQPLQLSSYTEDMLAQGRQPASRLLEVSEVPADDELAGLLDVSAGDNALLLRRLRLADGEPMAIENTDLTLTRFPGLTTRLVAGASLYSVLPHRLRWAPGYAD